VSDECVELGRGEGDVADGYHHLVGRYGGRGVRGLRGRRRGGRGRPVQRAWGPEGASEHTHTPLVRGLSSAENFIFFLSYQRAGPDQRDVAHSYRARRAEPARRRPAGIIIGIGRLLEAGPERGSRRWMQLVTAV